MKERKGRGGRGKKRWRERGKGMEETRGKGGRNGRGGRERREVHAMNGILIASIPFRSGVGVCLSKASSSAWLAALTSQTCPSRRWDTETRYPASVHSTDSRVTKWLTHCKSSK